MKYFVTLSHSFSFLVFCDRCMSSKAQHFFLLKGNAYKFWSFSSTVTALKKIKKDCNKKKINEIKQSKHWKQLGHEFHHSHHPQKRKPKENGRSPHSSGLILPS
eukprot:TRINITY_DN15910_c0_g1_i1.p1 TRINITY_DN15910_c0_g1~~TRINITY_DN15910_c0_g1_i1.p1  ORF type:complete len:104 (+),score=6.37 TRINITY_DN15910_c0_g1_i1:276-587(+)